MRIAFVSHNDLGLACLEELDALGADVRAIYTRPREESVADQTSFEGIATETGADLQEIESVNTDAVVEQLRAYDPDLLYVVGWSRLVDERVIDVSNVATLGMHPAPLPRGRGRAPIAWTLIKGFEETALSIRSATSLTASTCRSAASFRSSTSVSKSSASRGDM